MKQLIVAIMLKSFPFQHWTFDFCLKLNEKDFLKTFCLRNKAFYHSFWHPEIMIMLFSRFSQASYAMTNWTSYDKKMTAMTFATPTCVWASSTNSLWKTNGTVLQNF